MSRLAFVTTMAGFPWGGSELLWVEAACGALESGNDVLAVVFDWANEGEHVTSLRTRGATVIRRPLPQTQGRIKRLMHPMCIRAGLRCVPAWIRDLTRFGPDAVLFSSGNTYEWLSAAAALQSLRNGGVPYAVVCQLNSEQHALDKGKRILARKLFSHAQWVAFVSEHNKRLAERQMGMSLEWAVIVKNPVNLKSLEEIPWPDGTSTVFASIARLDVKYKGQDTLFEVLSRPQWLDREWECRLFGKGPDLLYLSELAEYFGIARRIRFMGHVSDIRQAWKECHMLVLPSHAEGTPLALVEAMLCGRPAVVTDAGGNGEWIQEPVSGFFSEAATTYSFGLAMERAWQSRNNWKKMGDAARDFAIKNFEPRAGEYVANIMERIAEKKNLT